MPTKVKVANNAFGELATSISSGDTTIVLSSGNGARFPSLSGDEYFYATLADASNQLEIIKVTARSTDTLTAVRAQDGTTAKAYDAGDRIELRPVAALFADLIAQGNQAGGISYDNTASGLTATDVQAALDEVATTAASPSGYFAKMDRESVAWTKTGNQTAETGQKIFVEVDGEVKEIDSGTPISMPTLTVGTDYAIWVAPDGSLEADASFSTPPTAGGRRVGGFHYAPGGRATLDLNAGDGGTTPQIMETSFYDLKWRPSVVDPRGLVLIGNGAFWAGMYHMSANHLTGPVHKYNAAFVLRGNPPQNINGSGNYPDAYPANLGEALRYHGFRIPTWWDFQLLAFGVTEGRSVSDDSPTTGIVTNQNRHQQTSAWGVFDATGVRGTWGFHPIQLTTDQTDPQPVRGDAFRFSRFSNLGGGPGGFGTGSGSRHLQNFDIASADSDTFITARGVCDHLILD